MHALIFGGNGRIACAMTQLLLARSWAVTSIIRNPRQEAGMLALGEGKPGKIHVLYYDLSDLKTASDAEGLFTRSGADCGVFAAG
jgi:NAD(P)-dependent dehydrogenase (short-subunit alcohol dehydrogenase family)